MKRIVTIGCLLTFFVFFTASCSFLPPLVKPNAVEDLSKTPGGTPPELFAKISDINQEVHSSRGIGSIRLEGSGREITARLAWAAQRPDKLRVELLGPFGTTLGRFATDGKRSWFYAPEDQRIYETRFPEKSLAQLLSLPVRVSELVRIMNGSVPVRYDRPVAVQADADGSSSLLVLQNFGFGGYQTILIREAERFIATEVFGWRRDILYGVRFFDLGVSRPVHIPGKWVLYGEGRTSMTFVPDRCEVNIDLPADLFQLVRKP